ncbi:MAG TPA: hypothetical protein VGH20_20045 [Myxococcales bacterium]
MFSLKIVARPDPRMVEVPLEIVAELPREFDGAAVLASSGLPRKVKLKAPKDALKLSTAYRADQLLADVVRTSFRGTASDVQRVRDAVTRFVRNVRERRQDGATLTVSANGSGSIDVAEHAPNARAAPRPTPPPARVASPPPPDRRAADLQAALTRMARMNERLEQLEQQMTGLGAQLTHLTAVAELTGPGMQERPRATAGQRDGTPRRATAVEAYAEGLRAELRVRAEAGVLRGQKQQELCDKAAALAAEAEVLGAPADGTAPRLQELSAQGAARLSALQRFLEEIDLYATAELPVAKQLLERLEDGEAMPDPAAALEPLARALRAKGGGADEWLSRAAAVCRWPVDALGGEANESAMGAAPDAAASSEVEMAAEAEAQGLTAVPSEQQEHDEVESVLAAFDAARPIPLPAPTAASIDPTEKPFGALPAVKAVEVNDDELVHGEDEVIELKELPPDDPPSSDT